MNKIRTIYYPNPLMILTKVKPKKPFIKSGWAIGRCLLTDAYHRLNEALSKKLPQKSDRELLGELLSIQRKGGKEELRDTIKSMIDKIGSDI